jgi:hypothetical protein
MLTTKEVEHAKPGPKPYRLFDGLGLYLEVAPNGGKYWRLKYRLLGKEKRLAFGRLPEMTLLEAREKRDQARKLIAQNIDPAIEKKDRRDAALANLATTFELVVREWHENHKERWSARHGQDILHRMEMDIFPQTANCQLPISRRFRFWMPCGESKIATLTRWRGGRGNIVDRFSVMRLLLSVASGM